MKNTRHARGITLIETLVWIALTVIIVEALGLTLNYYYRTNRYAIQQANAVTSGQRGLDRMVRVIREAAYSSEGAFPIVSIDGDDLVFYADIDADPLIERVHYFIDGTTLVEGIIEPSGNPPAYSGSETESVIAEYVRNTSQSVPLFEYFDELGNEITSYSNWANVRFIKATLIVNVDESTLPNQLSMSSSASLRNLIGR